MSSALGGANSALAEPDAAAPRSDGSRRERLRRSGLPFASDARLARRAASGDPAAFEEIFRRYQQDLYRFCVGILREPQDAQDAVQNTMIRAMRALPGETREMQLKPWLYRIAHNEAVELRRRERTVEPLGPTVDDGTAGTEELAEQDMRLQTLLADIADLPERQRASLVMRELNGLGFGEIGAALETSPGAVRQALYEARRGLSQMESSRDMDCAVAMKQVSDADGSPTRRGIRAHLRGCLKCRRFQAEIRDRRQTLAAISPMPAIAVATLLKAGLGGSGAASGAASAGGGSAAAAGAASAAGSSIAAGGSAVATGGAGALGVSGLVKAAAGLIAAAAVGTVAVDHGAILRPGQDPGRPDGRTVQVRRVEAAQVKVDGAARLPIAAGRRAGAAARATAGRSNAGTDREGLSAPPQRGNPPASAGERPPSGTSPSAAAAPSPPAGTGGPRRSSKVTEKSLGVDSPGTGIVGDDGQAREKKSHTEHPEPSHKAANAEAKEVEKAEAKAEKAQAKAEKTEAKVEKQEAKEHPGHPEHGNSAASTGGPARTTPETSATPAEPSPTPSEPTSAKEHPEPPEHPAHPEETPDESAVTKVAETTTQAVTVASELLHGNAGH